MFQRCRRVRDDDLWRLGLGALCVPSGTRSEMLLLTVAFGFGLASHFGQQWLALPFKLAFTTNPARGPEDEHVRYV